MGKKFDVKKYNSAITEWNTYKTDEYIDDYLYDLYEEYEDSEFENTEKFRNRRKGNQEW